MADSVGPRISPQSPRRRMADSVGPRISPQSPHRRMADSVGPRISLQSPRAKLDDKEPGSRGAWELERLGGRLDSKGEERA